MSERNQTIIDRVARAEKDLLEYKTAQIFGKDVTRPKVLERYNSDGTPTEWDVIGEYNSNSNQWRLGGEITYTAYTQESPWATVYAVLQVNPTNNIVAFNSAGFSAYADYEGIFSGGKSVKFEVNGSASTMFGPPSDPTIDRLWVKIYVFATDYGQIKLDFPAGAYGAGTLVALT